MTNNTVAEESMGPSVNCSATSVQTCVAPDFSRVAIDYCILRNAA
jgi:hypothetical protein